MAKRPIKEAEQADNKAKLEASTWKRELQIADKREKNWRQEAKKIYERYTGENRKRNRFNILWSNTEILRPAIYNTSPMPDVRRRFRDSDPVGKAVSEVLERALFVFKDGYEFDCAAKNDVLDTLLPGRGVSRIRYIPQIAQQDMEAEEGQEPIKEEKLEYEQVIVEHVDWEDFRHGYGRTWAEVPWVAFRHKLTRKDSAAKFGDESIAQIKFTTPTQGDENRPGEPTQETAKVAEFWEFWDKDGSKVFFTNDTCDHLLFPIDNPDGAPPIDFDGFFPCPEPLKIIENTGSTLPIPMFRLYEEQANELDRLTARIDKIVAALKLRGFYDGKLSEMSSLLTGDDNELIPVQNAAQYANAGGLDKAISWMPVEQAGKVLIALNEARDKQKQIIDELTGISDIIRGVTDANETYGAQELKSQYASVRLQRMQKEVQRYMRDLMRLAAQVIASKFNQDTLAQMTDLKFPTMEQKQAMQQQMQMAQQSGQPPPFDPSILKVPAWEEVMQLLRSPVLRQYRVDIETDSTIAGMLDSDASGMTQVMSGVTEMLTGLGPIVQSGALPVDAAKELVMAVIRRARLGNAVEDAFDKMQAPQPAPPPPDHSLEVAQIKAQSDEKIAAMKIQAEAQNSVTEHQAIAATEQSKQQLEAQRHNMELQTKAQLDMAEKEHAAQLEQLKMESEERIKTIELEVQKMIADANNQTKVLVAQIQANAQAEMQKQQQAHDQQMTQVKGEQEMQKQEKQQQHEKSQVEAPTVAAYEQVESNLVPVMKELISSLNKPKRVMRDDSGKIVGVQ